MMRFALLALMLSILPLPALAVTPIVADISNYRIDIDSGFNGTRIFLFGARNDNGDVVVVVRGPRKDFMVRKKEQIMGIWMNRERMKFFNVPDFYAIIGSKRHKASKIDYPWQRKILSFIVQKATKFLFGLNVSDTQTGLKIFKREVLVKVLPRLIIKRWAFDLEILTVANRLGYKKIYESPIELTHNFMSNVGLSSVQNFAVDYLAILYRTYILRYYDDGGSDQWEHDPALILRYR